MRCLQKAPAYPWRINVSEKICVRGMQKKDKKMSIDFCFKCGVSVDTDLDTETYELDECMCQKCRSTNDCDICGKHPAIYYGKYHGIDTDYCGHCAERT